MTINAIVVKLLEFYPTDPTSWFLQGERQFRIWSISQDKTKFWQVLSTLDAVTSTRTSRVITRATPGNKYQSL